MQYNIILMIALCFTRVLVRIILITYHSVILQELIFWSHLYYTGYLFYHTDLDWFDSDSVHWLYHDCVRMHICDTELIIEFSGRLAPTTYIWCQVLLMWYSWCLYSKLLWGAQIVASSSILQRTMRLPAKKILLTMYWLASSSYYIFQPRSLC
jgi:hypothetical protein